MDRARGISAPPEIIGRLNDVGRRRRVVVGLVSQVPANDDRAAIGQCLFVVERHGVLHGHRLDTGQAEAVQLVEIDELDAIRQPTIADLRKAIIMNEVLGKPMALRGPHSFE